MSICYIYDDTYIELTRSYIIIEINSLGVFIVHPNSIGEQYHTFPRIIKDRAAIPSLIRPPETRLCLLSSWGIIAAPLNHPLHHDNINQEVKVPIYHCLLGPMMQGGRNVTGGRWRNIHRGIKEENSNYTHLNAELRKRTAITLIWTRN